MSHSISQMKSDNFVQKVITARHTRPAECCTKDFLITLSHNWDKKLRITVHIGRVILSNYSGRGVGCVQLHREIALIHCYNMKKPCPQFSVTSAGLFLICHSNACTYRQQAHRYVHFFVEKLTTLLFILQMTSFCKVSTNIVHGFDPILNNNCAFVQFAC